MLHLHEDPRAQEPAGPLRVGLLVAPPLQWAELRTEGSLEAAAEVLIKVAIDDGVGAAVEEGQPVGEGEGVDRDQVQLRFTELPVVDEQQQSPERQPRQCEEECHHDQHVYHPGLAPGPAPALRGCLPAGLARARGLDKLACDADVHDYNERQRRQVDVREEHSSVDLAHALLRPGLPARVEWVGEVTGIHHEVVLLARNSQRDGRGAHDKQGYGPDDRDGDQRLP